MNEANSLLIWDYIKNYFNKNDVELAANRYIDALVESGLNDDQLRNLVGHDDALDEAIQYYLEDDDDVFDSFDDDVDDDTDYD